MMSVLARQGTGLILFTKGAPEALLPRCTQVSCKPALQTVPSCMLHAGCARWA